LTTSNLVDSHREIILTSVGKEYTIERLKDNFPDSKILLSPILVEEEEEVSE
jgi:uncharacterized protein (UPF0128 family)